MPPPPLPPRMPPPLPFHAPPSPALQPIRGPHFSYQLPMGWRVIEEGPYALVLHAANSQASIIVFGQTGLMQPFSPDQYAYYALTTAMRIAPDVRFVGMQPAAPAPGCHYAADIACQYTVQLPQGQLPCFGLVRSHVAHGYGHCTGVLTLAASAAHQWSQYQAWLPAVALAAVNTGPNPYGSTAMAHTMADISQRDHAATLAYQQYVQQSNQGVVDARNASIDWQQGALGPMLTGQQWHTDPYGGQPLRRSTTPAVIWRSYDGRELASDDPTFDPRTPSDPDWRRVR